jgi:hypothetical protein
MLTQAWMAAAEAYQFSAENQESKELDRLLKAVTSHDSASARRASLTATHHPLVQQALLALAQEQDEEQQYSRLTAARSSRSRGATQSSPQARRSASLEPGPTQPPRGRPLTKSTPSKKENAKEEEENKNINSRSLFGGLNAAKVNAERLAREENHRKSEESKKIKVKRRRWSESRSSRLETGIVPIAPPYSPRSSSLGRISSGLAFDKRANLDLLFPPPPSAMDSKRQIATFSLAVRRHTTNSTPSSPLDYKRLGHAI